MLSFFSFRAFSGVSVTETCARKILSISSQKGVPPVLRLSVQGGGCSGFEYNFKIGQSRNPDDVVVERDGAAVVVDPISMDFVKGSTIDYASDLMRSAFVCASNPNAVSTCGCKTSFAPKES
jgi:iron-sulfur cluster assembly accessory protein